MDINMYMDINMVTNMDTDMNMTWTWISDMA